MLTEMVFKNEHATEKLHYEVATECNVDDKKILQNVLENSRRCKRWLKSLPENDRQLVICGSGASISGQIATISKLQDDGAVVWALNNAAGWLLVNGITPDAQVIMDAQPVTLNCLRPEITSYLASQVDPSLFGVAQNAYLWHTTLGNVMVDEQEGFPQHCDDYCMVGSAVSVGNTAMVLGYTQGFRDIHLFGYDSSNSHVAPQPWNDGEPMTIVGFNGKEYVCSLTMSLQAKTFMGRARALEAAGCKISVYGEGLLPDMWAAPPMTEQEKYRMMWQHDDYRIIAPAEECADLFLELVKPDSLVIDFGCGTGRGALKISKSVPVLLLDFADNCRDEAAKHLPFALADFTNPIRHQAKYGFCVDVMEHIPPESVEIVIKNITAAAETVFFQISTIPDSCGDLIGEQLHLTVRPHEWWADLFLSLGLRIAWQQKEATVAMFVVSSAS